MPDASNMDLCNKIIAVKPLDNYMLQVKFEGKGTRLFDMKPYIKGEFFGQLKDKDYFNSVYLTDISIEWANGQDMCPDVIYNNSIRVRRGL